MAFQNKNHNLNVPISYLCEVFYTFPLGWPEHRREVTIKIDLSEIRLGSMDWIDLAQVWDEWRVVV
jgi:hypothetical protein